MPMNLAEKRPIRVRSSSGEYAVHCQPGLLGRIPAELASIGSFSSVHLLTSKKVWKVLREAVFAGYSRSARPPVHFLDDAEAAKTLTTVERAARSLVRAGADRHSAILAVGGGVVGDLAGFVAASYLRGVGLIQVPTTLVAQVDSSVGGKTGVNLPEGKNLVGAFYPAKLVLVDPEALHTLPEREFRGGLAEVIKYGVIADPQLFAFLEENMDLLLKRDPRTLLRIIRRSIQIKANVVSRDEKESSLREILNYGHTFGHALESATKYMTYQHGEAIAWGMICAGLLGHEVAGMPADDVARMVSLIRRTGELPAWPKIAPQKLIEAMGSDKKRSAGRLRFVLSPKIGQAKSYDGIDRKKILCVLRLMGNSAQKLQAAIGPCND